MVFLFFGTIHAKSAITYNFAWGRLGDQLLHYCKAKYISLTYNVPFLYKPFEFSDAFVFHELEERHTLKTEKSFKHTLLIDDEQGFRVKKNTLYFVGFAETKFDYNLLYKPEIRSILRAMLQPRLPLTLTPPPANKISIALHVRRGGGYDKPLLYASKNFKNRKRIFEQASQSLVSKYLEKQYQFLSKDFDPMAACTHADLWWPLKFPPDSYYIEQLQKVLALYPGQSLHCHIFTDDQNPESIAHRYQHIINNPLITFDWREGGDKTNGHNKNVLEDLFSMTLYDVLIRPDSSYSNIAGLIGNHQIVIYPVSFVDEDDRRRIDKVFIVDNR